MNDYTVRIDSHNMIVQEKANSTAQAAITVLSRHRELLESTDAGGKLILSVSPDNGQ